MNSRRNPKGAGRKPKPTHERKVQRQITFAPDLDRWLVETVGTRRGAISRYVEGLVRKAEIESRIL